MKIISTIEKIFTFTKEQLDQHDLEIRADERKKVCEELEKYIKEISYETTASVGGFDYSAVDFEDLQQKLTELKGEKDE